MTTYVERTCTEVGGDRTGNPSPLKKYRESDAYVLLGEPGSGKTRSFQEEARRTELGVYVAAHDFVELNRTDDWRNKTLFVDALDELRADSPSPEPIGRIRARLDELGRPRFRLSCRDADWYSAVDRDDLAKVSKNGQITALKMAPLSDDEVREFLAALKVDDPDAFINTAAEGGVAALLRNPLSLKLLVDTVAGGRRPQSRTEVFETSCRSLLREHNPRHVRGRDNEAFDAETLLNAAGHLCAVALLAGKRGYAWHSETQSHWVPLEDLPGCSKLFKSVLRTRLVDSPAAGQFAPLHKHIAEFLAGRYLASRVTADLPATRAMALMSGFDGRVVSPLRGVWAWFAAQCPTARAELIDGDPLGVVLYGDVKQFSVGDKRRLLQGVRRHVGEDIQRIPTDCWDSPRWADMATADAAGLIREVFSTAPASEESQLVARLLVDTPQRRTFPELKPLLLSIVRTETLWAGTRQAALRSLILQFHDDARLPDDLDGLLTDIGAGRLTDDDDELTGRLLSELYRRRRSLTDVKGFLHAPKYPELFGYFRHFWTTVVHDKANNSEKAEARRLSSRFKQMIYDDDHRSIG